MSLDMMNLEQKRWESLVRLAHAVSALQVLPDDAPTEVIEDYIEGLEEDYVAAWHAVRRPLAG